MLEQLLSIFFQVTINVLLIKLYHDIVLKKAINGNPSKEHAQTTIERLEKRNAQLASREAAAHDKIWKLEDENMIMKIRLRELMNQLRENEPEPEDDDPEDEPRAL